METIQIVLDEKLLRATDRAARGAKRNRSALVHDALRHHLRRLSIQESEARDRHGHTAAPQRSSASSAWETEAAWPEE